MEVKYRTLWGLTGGSFIAKKRTAPSDWWMARVRNRGFKRVVEEFCTIKNLRNVRPLKNADYIGSKGREPNDTWR